MSDVYILNQYKIYTNNIGKGSFSRVYKALDTNTNVNVAVKVINKTKIKENVLNKIQSEINILKSVDHINILKFIEVIYNENLIYIFTELCDTTLKYVCNSNNHKKYINLSNSDIKSIMIQIKNALQYLYNKNIYHRDLKLQNILYNKSTNCIKICDFGFAKVYDDDFLNSTLCGTPHYLAPEILKNNEYHKSSDLWSVGVIYYYLSHNKLPFEKCINMLDLTHNIDNYEIQYLNNIDINLQKLLKNLLNKNPHMRITWEQYFNDCYFNETINELKIPHNTEFLNDSVSEILNGSLAINIQQKINKNKEYTTNKINDLNIIDNYIQSPSISEKKISVNSYSSSSSFSNELYKSLNNSFNKILNLTPPFFNEIKKSF